MTFKKRKEYLAYLKTREVVYKISLWSQQYLDKKLEDFDIIKPRFPLSENARYEDWKIHFERFFPYLRHGVILIGVSLGGVFLAKYLSENTLPKRIRAVFLVGAPFDDSCPTEDLVGGFTLKSNLSRLNVCTENLHLLFSEDDPVVPIAHARKYQKKLPSAHITVYKSKNGHFIVPTFPEIIRMIKKLS